MDLSFFLPLVSNISKKPKTSTTMAATTTKLLQLRPKLKSFPPPKPFSSSSSSSSSNPNTENTPPPPERPNTTPTDKPFSFASIANKPPDPSSKSSAHFDQLRRNLAQLRLLAETPSPPSFQHLNKDNVGHQPNRTFDFSSIRANLRKFNESNTRNESNDKGKLFDSLSLSRLKDSLKLRPDMDTDVKRGGMVIGGGSGNLPSSIFGREMMMMRDKEGGVGVVGGENERMKGDFDRMYSYGELGEKLKKLRPVNKDEKGAFSLHELKERLMKVRENDEKETTSKAIIGDDIYRHLKVSLFKLKHDEDEEKAKKASIQRFDILEHLGGTPSFMLNPPKEHLVEKYFHPDHMSSGEKIKLELQKVRDEFKMSESDCGSARVQVAQLTTKIKHLSTVLHKKDKQSRKGLQEMVQKRKKLLKYLRKTDWDSYCLVLSKLGLRDNPDYKF